MSELPHACFDHVTWVSGGVLGMRQTGNSAAKTSTWSKINLQRRGDDNEKRIDNSDQNCNSVTDLVFLTFHKPPESLSDVLRVDGHLNVLRG